MKFRLVISDLMSGLRFASAFLLSSAVMVALVQQDYVKALSVGAMGFVLMLVSCFKISKAN